MEKEFDRREYNRMCVELLGYVNKTLDDKDFNIHEHPITKHMIETNFTNVFTEDWNWIIKVIEKIEWLDWFVLIDGITCKIYKDEIKTFQEEFIVDSPIKKDAVVLAIWEFLNWYNENKNK
jgi:hypothetical protein